MSTVTLTFAAQRRIAQTMQAQRREEDQALASGVTPAQRAQIAEQRRRRFRLWAELGNAITEEAAVGR